MVTSTSATMDCASDTECSITSFSGLSRKANADLITAIACFTCGSLSSIMRLGDKKMENEMVDNSTGEYVLAIFGKQKPWLRL